MISQIENLVSSANENLVQNGETNLRETEEESDENNGNKKCSVLEELHTESPHQKIKDKLNKFILEMTNLRNVIQS